MVRDISYEAEVSRRKRAELKASSYAEKYNDSARAWKEAETQYKITEALARELCQMILGKEVSETKDRLNEEYTWDNVKSDELLRKAKQCYQDYCKKKSEKLEVINRRLKFVEDEKSKIGQNADSLIDAIKDMFYEAGLDETAAEANVVAILNGKNIDAVINKLSPQLRERAQKGELRVITKAQESDADPDLEKIGAAVAAECVKAAATAAQVTIIEPESARQRKEKARKNVSPMYVGDIDELGEKLSDAHWALIRSMGSTGYSRYAQIEAEALKFCPEIKPTAARTAMKEIQSAGIAESVGAATPISKSIKLIKLSDLGCKLYSRHYEKDPVQPEMDRVRSEHDNYEHGYGILEVAQLIEEMSFYDTVSAFNRQTPVKLKNGREYVPDIVAKKGKRTDYFEYERGKHTQKDFEDKCGRMLMASGWMNFITQNRHTLEQVKKQVDKWLAGQSTKGLKGRIRLTTADRLKTNSIQDEECWLVIYDLGKSQEPVKKPEGMD